MTTLGRLDASLDWLLTGLRNLCMLIASLGMVALIVTFGWLVFGRYVLNATPTWVEQLALLLVGYITFLGAAAGVRDDSHLGVTFVRDGFGPRIESLLRLVGDVMLTVFGGFMFLASLELVRFGWDTPLPMLDIPESFRAAAPMICGGLVCLFAGTRAVRRILCTFAPQEA